MPTNVDLAFQTFQVGKVDQLLLDGKNANKMKVAFQGYPDC